MQHSVRFEDIFSQILAENVSFWLLAHESRDLSQAETKIIVSTS